MRLHERGPIFSWPDEALTLLKTRWADGASASEIAKEIGQGVSRNAVIGKLSRLKLQRRDVKAAHPGRTRKANEKRHGNFQQPKANAIVAKALQRQAPSFPVEPYDVEDTEGVDVTHLVGRVEIKIGCQCYWPFGDPLTPEFRFCGKPTNDRRPYCDEHAGRAGIGYGKGPRP